MYLEGSLKTREYDDKDNVKRKVTEINAVSLNILSKKGADAPEETESIQASSDDLPVHEG